MILYGASGHGKVIAEILILLGQKPEMFIDDNPDIKNIFEIPVLTNKVLDVDNSDAIISIGNNRIRQKIAEKYSLNYKIAIHPTATVSVSAKILEGTVVMANACINPDVTIGRHVIVNTSSVVEHDCKIGDYVHISPNSSLAGNVSVGEGTQIGIGASVIQGINIGKWVTIGAGAVVIRDVPDFVTIVGNPGKIIKFRNQEL